MLVGASLEKCCCFSGEAGEEVSLAKTDKKQNRFKTSKNLGKD